MGKIDKIRIGFRYKYKNQLDESDDRLYTQKELELVLKDKYDMTLEEYYNLVVHEDKNFPHTCKNPECGKKLKFLGLKDGYRGTCNRECADRYHSYHMVEITKTGVYKGTSHFIKYNSLESTKELRRSQVKLAYDDKSSRAMGSEWVSRESNYHNILARYNCDDSIIRYLYLFKFDNEIKIGSTVNIKRRWDEFGNPEVSILIKGHLKEIARYEMEALREFIDFTLRKDGKFSEFLPIDKLSDVLLYYEKLLSNSTTIEKVNLYEEIQRIEHE